ncbi:MAG: XrtA-associated ATPase [Sphingobium sp.]
MYDQYYEFKGRPFQLTPDPHFYYESLTHRKALSYLGYGMAQGEGFIVITGDIGSGKTTLVGHVMSNIDPARLTAVKIVSTQVEGDDLLRLVAQQFNITDANVSKAQLLQRIEAFLHAQARKGLRTLLIVDEAQGLSISAIEELRMLSNFQLGGQALLQIFLLGQPEFRDLLNSVELEQLRQRVIATHHLEPMQADEVAPYVHHRLALVGWGGNPDITAGAFAAIYAATDGVPRRVNALMSRILLLGAVDRLREIDENVVQAVAADMGLDSEYVPEEMTASPLDDAAELAEESATVSLDDDVEGLTLEPEDNVFTPEPADAEPIAAETEARPFDAPVDAEYVEAGDLPNAMHVDESMELMKVREEIDEMRRIISLTGDRDDRQLMIAERLDAIEMRVNSVEARSEDQEAALRRVLTLLVEWVEKEEQDVRAA